jgi:phytoene synthase
MPDTDPASALALSYALDGRAAAAALLALDQRLADIVAKARDPLIGQMRLTWWREALEALDRAPPPAEPILRGLAELVLPRGVSGVSLGAVVDGWEALLETPLNEDAIERHGKSGAALFVALATVTGARDPMAGEAGSGRALAVLARHLGDRTLRERVAMVARRHLDAALAPRWSRAGRAVGALALLARQDLDGSAPVVRLARLLRYRLTGR